MNGPTPQPDRETLLKWAEAQLDANRIAQSQLNIERRKERIQLELIEAGQHEAQETRALRVRIEELLDYLKTDQSHAQEVSALKKEVHHLLNYLNRHALRDDAIQDFFRTFSERFEAFERGMMLMLMERLDSPQTQAEARRVVDGLQGSLTISSKQRQLAQWYSSLNKLEERRARGDNDLETLNGIDEAKEEILRLEAELSEQAATAGRGNTRRRPK